MTWVPPMLSAVVGALCASIAFAQDVSAPAPDTKPAKQTGACAQWIAPGLEEGPVAMGFYDADTTSARRVCPRTEVSLGGRLAATVDNPDFYGNIGANALLSGSWAQTDTREFFATLEVLHYGFVQNAVINQPAADVVIGKAQCANCVGTAVRIAGRVE